MAAKRAIQSCLRKLFATNPCIYTRHKHICLHAATHMYIRVLRGAQTTAGKVQIQCSYDFGAVSWSQLLKCLWYCCSNVGTSSFTTCGLNRRHSTIQNPRHFHLRRCQSNVCICNTSFVSGIYIYSQAYIHTHVYIRVPAVGWFSVLSCLFQIGSMRRVHLWLAKYRIIDYVITLLHQKII